MPEERSLKLDVVALALLGLTVFLAAALVSYDPADPPSKLVYPERAETLNLCGRSGAMVSSTLLEAFGAGAYYIVVSLIVFDAVLLARRKIGDPLLRAAGWLLSLAGLTTLIAMTLPQLAPGPAIGPGGYLGAAGRGLLEPNFAAVGAYILAISTILGGLLLCTDYYVVRALAWSLGMPAKGMGHGIKRVAVAYADKTKAKAKTKAKTKASDLDEWEEEEEEPAPIRFAGQPDAEMEELEEEEDEDEEEAESDSADEEAPARPLRIRKPNKSQRQEVIEEIEAASSAEAAEYELPGMDLLLQSEDICYEEHEKDVRRKAKILEKTFSNFGFNVKVVEIQTGPVIAQFEIELEAGLRLAKITSLADDLAIALRVPSVRIVAPIPGKNTVGVEVPNRQRQLVRLRETIEEANGRAQRMNIPVYLGKDVAGNSTVVDLASMPHLLIAGRTGTGKSVCLNSIIVSMLMSRRPDEVKMLLIDPKMVELSPYKKIPHLMHPVVTDMRKAEAILGWAVEKMEERYSLLARAGVRHISSYNQLSEEELMQRIDPVDDEERAKIPRQMPFVVIVADELADLMMTSAKEVESHIIRLAQKSRAVGIHLVLATQKPTVDVITGLIKSNLPARIAFQVASRTDSRVVLDEMGADKLLGNGDMLFLWPGTSTLLRGQGTFISDDEISRVVDFVGRTKPQFVKELVQLKTDDKEEAAAPQLRRRDELYEGAIDLVIREGRGSVSLLQRSLGIGYGRAARLIDYMAEDGIVGEYNGSQAREILLDLGQWEQMCGSSSSSPADAEAAAPKRRSNTILPEPPSEPTAPWNEAVESSLPGKSTTPTRVPLKFADAEEEDEEEDEDYDEDVSDEPPPGMRPRTKKRKRTKKSGKRKKKTKRTRTKSMRKKRTSTTRKERSTKTKTRI